MNCVEHSIGADFLREFEDLSSSRGSGRKTLNMKGTLIRMKRVISFGSTMADKEAVKAYFEKDLGWMPESIQMMMRYVPDAMKALVELRSALMKPPPEGALPKKFKEILFVVIDAIVGNVEGGKAHARAAVKEGASVREIAEALGVTIYLTGLPTMERTGKEMLRVAEEAAK